MPDLTALRLLVAALAVKRRSAQRGQGSLEWVVIAGGAVLLALAVSAIVYGVTIGWGHNIQPPSGR